MDQARAAISNLFGGEPLSYTRFSIARQTDGDNSQVEMKLSAEEEEGGENGVPENMQTHHVAKPRTYYSWYCIAMMVVVLFLSGFLVGYLSSRGRMPTSGLCVDGNGQCTSSPPTPSSMLDLDETVEEEPFTEPILYWEDLRKMLSDSLKKGNMELHIRELSMGSSHEAGSPEDDRLAYYVYQQFTYFNLYKVWNDEHYVRLQFPGSSPNRVSITDDRGRNATLEEPEAYVAFSENATAIGRPVYAHYGRKEDFKQLSDLGVSVNGSVLIFRTGEISVAEQVASAERLNAVGVLIFPGCLKSSNQENLGLFGHAHLGTGDPFTPGFPSFNHTQFPPAQSSGLPHIPVQTISFRAANNLFSQLTGGQECPLPWRDGLSFCKVKASSTSSLNVVVQVNNKVGERKILNIFGVIRGFDEEDRYIVIGAQRDSWGPGAAKAGVGTSILLELARAISDMVKTGGYKPRRSIVFASWSAGDFGAVGATEWLEGYSSVLHAKVFTYINLDAAVLGSSDLKVSASPMLYTILERILRGMKDVDERSLFSKLSPGWPNNAVPLTMENAAFPFLAYSGIPALSFSFYNKRQKYPFMGTKQDVFGNLRSAVPNLNVLMRQAAELAGQIVVRLTHEHELLLDYGRYKQELQMFQNKIVDYNKDIRKMGLTLQWVFSARGDFERAVDSLKRDLRNSDLSNKLICRASNDRIMKVEYDFLSPFISPRDKPLRHIFFGSGPYTLQALLDHLSLLKTNRNAFDQDLFRNQLAMATWTIKEAANALSGDVWDTDNEF
ncbi:transferrin receptor protein 1 [Alligator mississippiensis]|uniref:transferrin receptor protein 1 n=1 Tax=Alligator mississippiensis TaxID=8496 RepID=UPI002877C862|nr:transferrin receptor protein 1 [Alligator mississippiensis]XP_019350918.2 transferrin receptor protein 1 [Alligator mississippiensis]XP_019350919.2 transferrin receptor protein 1 [Alligator mississippiensis]